MPLTLPHACPAALGRKMRIWERQLMRDFHVSPAMGSENTLEEEKEEDRAMSAPAGPEESAKDRFRRVAMLAMSVTRNPQDRRLWVVCGSHCRSVSAARLSLSLGELTYSWIGTSIYFIIYCIHLKWPRKHENSYGFIKIKLSIFRAKLSLFNAIIT